MAGSRPRFQVASRSAGKSVCSMAAYRAGEEIYCETYGETNDYTRKGGILHTEIMAPEHAPEWVRDRAALWNAVEKSELTKAGELKIAAQLARDIVVPLPHELDFETNRALLREWISEQFVSRGMIADFAIHAPDRRGDERNHHAHVMLTMREITPEGFHKSKATPTARSWNDKAMLEQSIDRWQDIQNRALELGGHEARADFRSFEARGIDQEPQQHEGPHVTAMKRKGKETRVGAENESRAQANRERRKMHVGALKELARIAGERQKFESWVAEKQGSLEAAQGLSMLDLTRAQELAADQLKDELTAYYEPHLATVRHDAEKLEASLGRSGLVARFRRVFTGKAERDRLDKLQSTIKDAENRKREALEAQLKRQAIERARLAEKQEQRRQEQHEGIERARERKEANLAEREARAKEAMQKAVEAPYTVEQWRQERRELMKQESERGFQDKAKDKGRDFEP